MSLLLPESGKYLSRYQAVDPRPATDCVGATRSVQLLVVLAWVVSAILNGASIVVWAQPVEPVLFAPETLSTGNVYRGTFTPDGRTFFFFKKVTEGEEDFRIFRSHLVEGYWTLPEQVQLGGDFSDLYPAISPDGQHMVFSSYRPAPGDTSAHASAYLWYVERSGDGWGEPVFMQEASALGHYHAQPIFDAQGHLSFARLTWNYRDKAEYVTRWESGRYLAADTLAAWQYWREHLPEHLHLYRAIASYFRTAKLACLSDSQITMQSSLDHSNVTNRLI